MTNKLILAALTFILVAYGIAQLPSQTTVAPLVAPEFSQEHIRALKALDEIDAIQVHCPSFLDAPLGIKPCPAQDILEHTKALIQAQVEATN